MNDFNFFCICFLLLCNNLPQTQWLTTTQMLLTSQFLWIWSPAPAELGPLLRELPACHQVSGRTLVSSVLTVERTTVSSLRWAEGVYCGCRTEVSVFSLVVIWGSLSYPRGHLQFLATCPSHNMVASNRERVSLLLQSAKMESYVMQCTHGSEKTPSPLPYLAH